MTFSLRPARPLDADAISTLLAESYPALLAQDYAPEVLQAVLPAITRARPSLVASGTYYVVEGAGGLCAAGGWSQLDPWGGMCAPGSGHIRHLVCAPRETRKGHARRILTHIFEEARKAGVTRLDCYSTLTAEAFYRAMGLKVCAPVVMQLGRGVDFPALHMRITL